MQLIRNPAEDMMNIFASFRKFFSREDKTPDSEPKLETNNSRHNPQQEKNAENFVKSEPGFEFLDGMSTGTARFIIDREVGQDTLEKYDIKDLENKGRYYLAKIINQDGHVTDTVLIDKQNRSIHFQKDKFR